MKLYIKNMACDSCKTVVRSELKRLNIPYTHVDFGEAEITGKLTEEKKHKLNAALKKSGLELLENKKGIIVERIKIMIRELIDHPEKQPKVKLSVYLSEGLNYDYKYLSGLFSVNQATTIEQYTIMEKIDRIKELILFDDVTLTEIARRFRYSSVAHLSAQFKKMTGLNPSHFKRLKKERLARMHAEE